MIEPAQPPLATADAVRIRGLCTPDALVVVFVAMVVAVFLEPDWPVGTLLIAAMAGGYGALRATRGQPTSRRLMVALALFVVPMLVAGALAGAGY